jgi:ubiquinone/menaquinone biosynthesis C-methylase UbiE
MRERVPGNPWKAYFAKTKERGPRPLLMMAVPYVARRDRALDLGSGVLNDTRYLLQEGFEHVTAVDREAVARDVARTLSPRRFIFSRSSFEDYGFPGNTFDLVTAQYSLPFIQATNFKTVFTKIKRSLVVDGVFTGQLFGDRDEWNGPPRTLTFLPRQEVVCLLADMEILELAEEEGDYPTVTSKQLKHWHLFHFIAKK